MHLKTLLYYKPSHVLYLTQNDIDHVIYSPQLGSIYAYVVIELIISVRQLQYEGDLWRI